MLVLFSLYDHHEQVPYINYHTFVFVALDCPLSFLCCWFAWTCMNSFLFFLTILCCRQQTKLILFDFFETHNHRFCFLKKYCKMHNHLVISTNEYHTALDHPTLESSYSSHYPQDPTWVATITIKIFISRSWSLKFFGITIFSWILDTTLIHTRSVRPRTSALDHGSSNHLAVKTTRWLRLQLESWDLWYDVRMPICVYELYQYAFETVQSMKGALWIPLTRGVLEVFIPCERCQNGCTVQKPSSWHSQVMRLDA